MSNHFHILLEVPPMPEGGLADDELLKRLSAIYTEALVAVVATELAEARKGGNPALAEEIHARYVYRMHDLSEFMKTLLQRFTRWFNRTHSRTGTLWEECNETVKLKPGVFLVSRVMVDSQTSHHDQIFVEFLQSFPRGEKRRFRRRETKLGIISELERLFAHFQPPEKSFMLLSSDAASSPRKPARMTSSSTEQPRAAVLEYFQVAGLGRS